MRSAAIFTVIGVCGVLSFGCAGAQKMEKEMAGVAKEAEKSGALKDVEKAVEKKVDAKPDAKDAKPAAGATGGADVDKGVATALSAHATVKGANSGGTVTLTGKVATAKDKTDAEAAVKKVSGVTKVVNEIAVGK